MNRVFGKQKKAAPAPSLDDASAGLGGRVDEMDKKIAGLELELKGYKDKIKKAKSPAAKKTLQKRAMEVLKRKRMYEQQRDMVAGQQFNIDQATFGIESAKANVQTVAAMKSAGAQLKQTLKNDLDIDAVEDLADDMAEMMEDFNEINEALGRNFATPDDLSETDLEAGPRSLACRPLGNGLFVESEALTIKVIIMNDHGVGCAGITPRVGEITLSGDEFRLTVVVDVLPSQGVTLSE